MKRFLFLSAFALSMLCVSCSKEQKIDRLISKAEKLVEDTDAYNREERLMKIGQELESYKESDFTSSQTARISKLLSDYQEY